MRKPAAAIIVLALAISFAAGCGDYRQDMAVAPDRDGHAAVAPGHTVIPQTEKVAKDGETYHQVAAGETLSSIAKQYNESLDTLVERNDITDSKQVVVGTNLVVNDPNAKH
jgi:LysM repeat protein